jgi:hypothetical protein
MWPHDSLHIPYASLKINKEISKINLVGFDVLMAVVMRSSEI